MEDGRARKTTVEQMIEAGVFAGAYRSLARAQPESAPGLNRMGAKWHARAATLADAVCDEAHGLASSGKFRTANSP